MLNPEEIWAKQVIGFCAVNVLSISPAMADQWEFRCLHSVGRNPVVRIQFAIDTDADGVGYFIHQGSGPRPPIRMVEVKELHRGPAGRPSEFETRWHEAAPIGRGGHYVYVNQGEIIDNFRYIRGDGTFLRFVDDSYVWTERGCTWATDGTHRWLSGSTGVRLPPSFAVSAFPVSTIIDTILSVGKTVFGLRIELAKARQERKQTVADFLDGLALSLEEASAQLKQGTYPAGKCQEILSHSLRMEAAIGDLVGLSEAQLLASKLAEVHEIERLYGELSAATDAERLQRLSVLDQAAGLFRATAAFVRVSP